MSMEDLWLRQSVHGWVLFLGIKSVYSDKSERNYRGKCLGWPVTSYGGGNNISSNVAILKVARTSILELYDNFEVKPKQCLVSIWALILWSKLSCLLVNRRYFHALML